MTHCPWRVRRDVMCTDVLRITSNVSSRHSLLSVHAHLPLNTLTCTASYGEVLSQRGKYGTLYGSVYGHAEYCCLTALAAMQYLVQWHAYSWYSCLFVAFVRIRSREVRCIFPTLTYTVLSSQYSVVSTSYSHQVIVNTLCSS